MSFPLLREKLGQEPSQELFREICQLFDAWSGEHIGAALHYTEVHLSSWEDKLRFAENIDWEQELPAWWPLVRSYRGSLGETPPRIWEKSPELLQDLTKLELSCESHTKIPPVLSSFTDLNHLYLLCSSLKNTDDFPHLPKLTELHLDGCNSLEDIDGISHLIELTKLHLFSCWTLRDVDVLRSLKKLDKLVITGSMHLKDMNIIASLTELTELRLIGFHSLEKIDSFQKLPQLEILDISFCPSLRHLPEEFSSSKLIELVLSGCEALENIAFLAKLDHLTRLDLRFCDALVPKPEKDKMTTKKDITAYQEKIIQYYYL